MGPAEHLYQRCPIWLQGLLLNAYAWRRERHRFGNPYRRAVVRLREQERWPADRLRTYQDARLREIVRIAFEKSPYYRQAMSEAGLKPHDISGVADLPKLPLLTREVVRKRGKDLLTAHGPRAGWINGHTSGTTGSPLSLWYDRQTCVLNNAQDRRQKIWGGMAEGDWIGVFLGRVIVPPGQNRPPFWRVNWMQRQVWFSSFHLSDDTLGLYMREIRRRKLRFLEGYPSTLFILAKYLTLRGERLPMQAVFTSSETLHQIQKDSIERAFECRLFDFYGLAERVVFASECEAHAGKHLGEEFGYAEVVDEEGQPVAPGTPGYLVGTSLHNTAMPMLRYRTSDVTAISPDVCPCGRTSRVIAAVTTKAEDIVVTPDGRMVSPSILTHPFKPFDQILTSQIIQDRPDHLTIKIVPSEEFTAQHWQALIDGLRQRLGMQMMIDLELVSEIPRDRSGKFRWVVSQVKHSCAISWSASAP